MLDVPFTAVVDNDDFSSIPHLVRGVECVEAAKALMKSQDQGVRTKSGRQ